MNLRVAYIDADAVLDAIGAQTSAAGEIHEAEVRGHQPKVTTAGGVGGIGLLISENGNDGKEGIGNGAVELAWNGRLGDEDDGVGQRQRAGSCTKKGERQQRENNFAKWPQVLHAMRGKKLKPGQNAHLKWRATNVFEGICD